LLEKGVNLSGEELDEVIHLIEDEIGYWYINQLITQVEKIFEIDSSFTESEILQLVVRTILEYLCAEVASIKIYGPEKKGMVFYWS
jgi:hypothetical protein